MMVPECQTPRPTGENSVDMPDSGGDPTEALHLLRFRLDQHHLYRVLLHLGLTLWYWLAQHVLGLILKTSYFEFRLKIFSRKT